MLSGIEYFKKMYTNVPNWVQVMHDYSPEMLTQYTQFRAEAFKSGVVSDIEKDELIAAVNAGRLYPRSMNLHTAGAQNKGSKLEHLIEYFLVSAYYNRKEALIVALQAIKQFLEQDGKTVSEIKTEYNSLLDVLYQINEWTEGYQQDFLNQVIDGLKNKKELRDLVFEEGQVSSKRKYLAYVGMFITELDGGNAIEAFNLAKANGVTDEELAELGYVIIFTSGIPSWFEMSDNLEPKQKIEGEK